MNLRFSVLFIITSLIVFACKKSESIPSHSDQSPIVAEATATIYKIKENGYQQYKKIADTVFGDVKFIQRSNVVELQVSIKNLLPNTYYSSHIHQGSIEVPGAHWNRKSRFRFCDSLNLGNPWKKIYAGDIGNILTDKSGNGFFTLKTAFWSLDTLDTLRSIVGRTIVLHHGSENFEAYCSPSPPPHAHKNKKIGAGSIIQQKK